MKKYTLFMFIAFLTSFMSCGQVDYLQKIEAGLNSGDCKDAQKWYLSYKDATGKTDADIERRIKECKNTVITKIAIEWVDIPGSTFTMGSPKNERRREDDEIQHQVTLSGFKMGKYQVTFAQYDAFCEATGREKPSDEDWGRDNRPVMNVSWDDAAAFCEWLGDGCRLPTEAEWEYACRAGTNTPFYTGDNISTSQANFNGDYPYVKNDEGEYREQTLPVGSFPPNPWGLYDMYGNVYEFCNDWYDSYPRTAQTNPQGPSSGDTKVRRGGNWSGMARFCRSAGRGIISTDYQYRINGFRVVFSDIKIDLETYGIPKQEEEVTQGIEAELLWKIFMKIPKDKMADDVFLTEEDIKKAKSEEQFEAGSNYLRYELYREGGNITVTMACYPSDDGKKLVTIFNYRGGMDGFNITFVDKTYEYELAAEILTPVERPIEPFTLDEFYNNDNSFFTPKQYSAIQKNFADKRQFHLSNVNKDGIKVFLGVYDDLGIEELGDIIFDYHEDYGTGEVARYWNGKRFVKDFPEN